MRVEVLKIARYDPTLGGRYSKYGGYNLSASEQSDPPIVSDACAEIEINIKDLQSRIYFHSTRLRGKQTADCIKSLKSGILIECPEIKEIPFSMMSLLSEEEFVAKGSNLVRQRFTQAFVDDKLLESRDQIKNRITKLLSILNTVKNDYASVGLISHSFFMKILEGIVTGVPVFDVPEKVRKLIPYDQKTYPFGGGFKFEV